VAIERALRRKACRIGRRAGAVPAVRTLPIRRAPATRADGRDRERSRRRAGEDGIDIRSEDTQA